MKTFVLTDGKFRTENEINAMDENASYLTDTSINSQFKVLLVYSNTPMDNLMPVSVSTLSGALKQKGFCNIKFAACSQ